MATRTKNLKVLLTGDTKPYREEVDKASVATNKFKGEASGALNEIASAFGVNIADIKARAASISTAFKALSLNMKGAATGAGLLSGAMKILKVALISTGIGALVVALGSLVAYFTRTERGAEFVERAMAGLKAVFDVLIDRVALFGEGIFKIFSGDFKGAWDAMKRSVQGVGTEMVAEAKAATDLQRRLQQLEDKERELINVNAERREQISELRLQAKEEGVSAQQRIALLTKAMAIEKQVAASEAANAKERADIIEKQIALGESRDEDYDRLAEAQAKVREIQTSLNESLRAYSREMKSANSEIKTQEEALLKLNLAKRADDAKGIKSIDAKPGEVAFINNPVDPSALKGLDDLAMKSYKAQSALDKLQTKAVDLGGVLTSGFSDMAVGVGEFFGALASGDGDMKSFGNMVASTFADMAISVGKIAIATGMATLGIVTALKSLNPWVAIAAGVALVALGTAVKGSLSSVASGGASSVNSSATSGNFNYDTRGSTGSASAQKIIVEVTGELSASGKSLSTVLNQENTRVSVAT